MPLYRAQVITQLDSLLARDAIVNTLHFDDAGALSDPEGLAGDLADIFLAGWTYSATQTTVKFYEVGTPPNYPVATVIRNEGAFVDSQGPREVALCLSYYSERNLPSRRGRIYLCIAQATNHSYGRRPQVSQRAAALALASAFAGLGGADVDWVVYSPKTGQHWDVTHAWCDDEWDVMRKRGLKATTRELQAQGS